MKKSGRFAETAASVRFIAAGYYLSYTHTMKTAVSLPDPLFRAAERLAKRLGMTRSHLYSCAIERYVSEAKQHDVTAQLNKVYEHESSDLDPVLEKLQELSIPREEW
jgi:metal-responsive CopG/Arc/MetJ family transcriptional regulator